MGRTAGWLFRILLFSFFPLTLAQAYTPTMAPNGSMVRWKGQPRLLLVGNPENRSGLSEDAMFQSVARSLQRWQSASGGRVGFDYWQGTDTSLYPPNSEYNGISTLHFSSNSATASSSSLSANVLGLTQVWFSQETGEILETDIVLNDRDYRFTSNPRDTSGYGSGGSTMSGGRINVYLENVLTHEFGHAYGLSHAGGMQSTMLFMESPEQAHLGCDDQVGIRAAYGGAPGSGAGTLAGAVVSDTGSPVFGAHVLAISRRRGVVLATAITDKAGHFSIPGMEAGGYFLMTEPFLAGEGVLPKYYSGMVSGVCSGPQSFARTFLTDGSRSLTEVVVSPGSAATAPTIQVQCTRGGGASVSASTASALASPVMYDGLRDGDGFGFIDRAGSQKMRYGLRSLAGQLELHVLSFSLYSPVRFTLTLVDDAGNPVNARVSERSYVAEDSGYVNYDAVLSAERLSGDYVLEITAQTLGASHYPAGPIMLDAVPFFVVTGSANEGAPPLAELMPHNARCRMSENFPAYRSPPGGPPRANNAGEDGTGFCGTLSRPNGGSGGGQGPGAAAIAGWFAPWLLMLAGVRLARLASRRSGGLASL